ncbi:histidinol-phosphatase HisJ [Bacillus solitudinis]|uniref:histidinol-phosphatase HisJ n=1 Tax=Bacillus solitudinis TaxID=2014074 RepID=UPI0018E1FFE3|nr:histidinol-phosphatase HisJ [Bacillus solitudinis]
MISHDGHVHTPFCPHGSKDSFKDYCEKAISLGLQSISFTEHAPLPEGFIDPTPQLDSAMSQKDLQPYLEELNDIKQSYQGKLDIFIGLEVDYIEGYELETTSFLKKVGPFLDDSILSVHFLKIYDRYVCIDYSPDVFEETVLSLGSIEAVYTRYYETLQASVQADLGPYKPHRIGHITLVKKFQKKFPTQHTFRQETTILLSAIKEKNYSIDYNGAGVIKPLCGEPYPNKQIIQEAIEMGIPLIYGSDAHQSSALMTGASKLHKGVSLSKP